MIGLVGPLLAEAYTHAGLDSLFMASGFPGEPPEGNKTVKCLDWLRRANNQCDEPLDMFGNLIAEFMDAEPSEWDADKREKERARIQEGLAKDGLTYDRGGRILGGTLASPSKSLAERLKSGGMRSLEIEFQRALNQVVFDPPAAVTAASAILEAVCKEYLTAENQPLPAKQALGPLWTATAAHLGLAAKNVVENDLKQILSGLASIANGVASLRTHKGSAHGHAQSDAVGKSYRLAPRHARLAIHAAHTLALFALETWEARRSGKQ